MTCKLRKLKGKIVEKYDSISSFADALGISRQVVYNKLSGVTDFSKENISEWCGLLEIPLEDIHLYFF